MSVTPHPPGPRVRRVRWRRLLAVALIGAAGVVGYRLAQRTPPVPPGPSEEALEPAVAQAVRAARDRVLANPNSAKAWGELGEVFFANELEDEARACFAEAARLDPDSSRWPYLEAAVLVNRGDREGALPHLRRARELAGERDDANPGPRFVLVESLLLLGRNAEAESHLRGFLDRNPSDPRGRFDAGLLAVAADDWEGARRHLLGCLDSPYARRRCRVQLAAVCRRLGDLARADEFQTEAARMPADPDWADPVVDACFARAVKKRSAYRVAERRESEGRIADALRVAQGVADDYPDDDGAQSLVGRLFAQMGDFVSAERALRRAGQLAPQKVQPHYLLSLVLIQAGEKWKQSGDAGRAEALFGEAAAQARAALAVKSDFGFAHMALGLALKNLGRPAEARAALEAAVQCSPEYAEMHLHLAEVLDESGRAADARNSYRQALQLAPPGTAWRGRVEARLAEPKADSAPAPK